MLINRKKKMEFIVYYSIVVRHGCSIVGCNQNLLGEHCELAKTREDRFWKPMLLDPAPPANTTGRGLTVMLAHLTPAPEFDDRVHWLTLRCVGIHGAYRSVLRAHARNWVPTTQNPALQIFLDKSASGHLGSGVFDQGLKEGNECLLPRGSRSRQLAEPADENVLAVARLQ